MKRVLAWLSDRFVWRKVIEIQHSPSVRVSDVYTDDDGGKIITDVWTYFPEEYRVDVGSRIIEVPRLVAERIRVGQWVRMVDLR